MSKISETRKPRLPKLVCMHFTSTSACMNFLSRFYFLTPMDYSPWSEGKFGHFEGEQIRSKISETGEAMLTKIGVHACDSTSTCINFFGENKIYFLPLGKKCYPLHPSEL